MPATEQTTNAQGGQDIKSWNDTWRLSNMWLHDGTTFRRILPVQITIPAVGTYTILTLSTGGAP